MSTVYIETIAQHIQKKKTVMSVRNLKILFISTLTLIPVLSVFCSADISLPTIFGDNMVLQQNKNIVLWGWSEAKEEVRINFLGQKQQITADDEGNWQVRFDPVKAGGPYEMTFSGNNTITLTNILIGEVWLCGGQSNMEQPIAGWLFEGATDRTAPIENYKKEIAEADFPGIRMFRVKKKLSEKPGGNVEGEWKVCTPEAAPDFAATAYFFGRHLHRKLGLPIGLINNASGGSAIEPWIRKSEFQADPVLRNGAEFLERTSTIDHWKNRVNVYGMLYNAMTEPLVGFGIRGVIWYQGESNVVSAHEYGNVFSTLISSWRKEWGQGDFPFYYCQLAPFDYGMHVGRTFPITDSAMLRQAQLETLALPNTGMVVTSDIGNAMDIHPRNKQEVGRRLAVMALAKTYGKNIAYSGPIYKSFKIEGDKIRISFSHTGSGLMSRDGKPLNWFTIAGIDKEFISAEAAIEGDTVVVHSDKLTKPVAVRFGWADVANHNLVNNKSLPASPFRTDSWLTPLEYLAQTDTNGGQICFEPKYKSMKIEGNRIRLYFNHLGGGLTAKENTLKFFTIAGNDKKFVEAEAVIEGDTVIVFSEKIAKPKDVGYRITALSSTSLLNKKGLPISPFIVNEPSNATANNK